MDFCVVDEAMRPGAQHEHGKFLSGQNEGTIWLRSGEIVGLGFLGMGEEKACRNFAKPCYGLRGY
ncbi:MAG: hypothetical protein ACK5YR_21015, partial [Pirellula sp.]